MIPNYLIYRNIWSMNQQGKIQPVKRLNSRLLDHAGILTEYDAVRIHGPALVQAFLSEVDVNTLKNAKKVKKSEKSC